MAERIKRGEKTRVPRLAAKEAADTTQVCVVDRDGMCVSLTHTLGTPSGVVTDGLGFMYNGAMGAFDPRPGRAASIAPGKARVSSMAPSIVFRRRQAVLRRRRAGRDLHHAPASCRRFSTWSISA